MIAVVRPMVGAVALLGVASGGAGVASAQVPSRPEQLQFPQSEYRPPLGDDYRHELSNGIPVYVVEDRTVPLVDVSVALPVGGHLDPPDRLGVASLSALLLRRAGSERFTAAELDRRAGALAIELNSLGGGERSGVTLSCLSDVLDQGLELLVEVLRRPRFEEERVDLALRNVRSSLAARRSDPSRRLRSSWNRLHYGAEYYLARDLTAADLDRLDPQRLREFHSRHWRPERLVVAVAGDVESAEVVRKLEALLGDWRALGEGERRKVRVGQSVSPPGIYWLSLEPEAPEAPAGQGQGRGRREPDVQPARHLMAQGQLLMGHRGLLRSSWDDRDLFAAMVMSEIFGGRGAVSRLSSRLRHREGLVYQIHAAVGIGLYQEGLFEVSARVSPKNAVGVARAVIEEMRRLAAAPPPPTELELAKKVLIDRLPLLFDGAETRAGRFAEDALLGRPHSYWQIYGERIRSIEASEVQRAARRHLRPEELRVLWLGPALPARDWASLGLGKPRELER